MIRRRSRLRLFLFAVQRRQNRRPLQSFRLANVKTDSHGTGRWAVKIDPSLPPTDASAIQSVTPSDIYGWPGIPPPALRVRRGEKIGGGYSPHLLFKFAFALCHSEQSAAEPGKSLIVPLQLRDLSTSLEMTGW